MSSSSGSDTDDQATDGSQSPLRSVLGKRSRHRMAVTYSDLDRYRSTCHDLLHHLSLNHPASISISDACYNSDGSLRTVSCQSQIGDLCLEFRFSKLDSIPTAASLSVSIADRLQSTLVFDCRPIPMSPDSENTAWIEARRFALTDVDLQKIASYLDLDHLQALSVIFAAVGVDLHDPDAISCRSGWLQHYSNAVAGTDTDPGYESEDSAEKRETARLGRRLKRQKQERDHILQLYLDHVWKPL